jgi:hypothetical protein
LLAKGVDPAIQEARQRAAEAARQADTVAAALELFIERHLAGLRTGHDVTVALRRLLKPWASRPISSITRKDVKSVVHGIHDAGKPIAANRALAYIKGFLAWAVERDLIDASPAALVKRPAKERRGRGLLRRPSSRVGCQPLHGPALTTALSRRAGSLPEGEKAHPEATPHPGGRGRRRRQPHRRVRRSCLWITSSAVASSVGW